MRVDAFDFVLPEDRIALRPVKPRDGARLLQVAPDGVFSDHIVRDLPQLLRPGDLLVLNETQVIPTQLSGHRYREGAEPLACSVTLVEEVSGGNQQAGPVWKALAKPGKRLKRGDRLIFRSQNPDVSMELAATVTGKDENGLISCTFDVPSADFAERLALVGQPPLPPYIAAKRQTDDADLSDYQTIYAKFRGSVAAPTAGLHFTDALFAALDARGVERAFVTLHVGMGTFLPVKAETTDQHDMHAEWGEITASVADRINATRAAGGRIIAVGTTSLRILESAVSADGLIKPLQSKTDIFITPGHTFRAIDGLMTNFHLPKSTLFMLVSALAGLDRMKAAYTHAIERGYRFYSYGDASLLWKAGATP
ncbi:MAG: tRNA preQ1(34) S-adenosylmethionine ribosyltransferase-isomerase QueA [Pseudomonadota bacterium]